MQKHYPTTNAQNIVLSALNEDAEHYDAAEALFAAYGISVLAVRKGRSSAPSISLTATGGAFNRYGEGETWNSSSKRLTAAQLAAILPYVVERDQADAQRMLAAAQVKESSVTVTQPEAQSAAPDTGDEQPVAPSDTTVTATTDDYTHEQRAADERILEQYRSYDDEFRRFKKRGYYRDAAVFKQRRDALDAQVTAIHRCRAGK